MAKRTLEDQIKKQQKEVWDIAEICDTDQMKLKDRIFEQGLVMEETKCLKNLYNDNSDEMKKDYLLLLSEMKVFYQKISKSQRMVS